MAATEATVEGPFFWAGAPELPLGSDLAEGVPGEPALYMGRVTDVDGKPGVAILLTYGPDRDWLKNLTAAGGGRNAMMSPR